MHDALWAPWRLQYLQELEQDARMEGGSLQDFLWHCWQSPSKDLNNHVLHRDEHGLIMLNRHPYASGHLLVALGEARPRLLEYSPAQRVAFWNLVEHAWELMQQKLDPQGINMGINEGAASGAGLPGHLHAHLVPRWQGDVNFMGSVAGVRVIPASLEDMVDLYRG
ncbi:MAG: HIT domain-containing protein [Phycisphaerales bacterium]|jgi:ATP adenylyltransferase|nr:HIT domain-containing protein [Phycisphaerales bacterium]MDP7086889.1 HIT domain-containing protein [Phycisphaerales bacterium]MDP7188750.1 HIT domain-containing protein [Phycisphaerales bacterium]MDP7519614.1 HIT domain-containing protein [Phycisphaerales bacterium]HCA38429.1 HIT family hydrolase [Phycisphaerales bacterium]|tara:strand:+ start:947 stop:1444 length:498 start_codon:yes stop_codon:yes gene_type:complete